MPAFKCYEGRVSGIGWKDCRNRSVRRKEDGENKQDYERGSLTSMHAGVSAGMSYGTVSSRSAFFTEPVGKFPVRRKGKHAQTELVELKVRMLVLIDITGGKIKVLFFP